MIFFNRVVDDWNNLPDSVVNASSVNNYKCLMNAYYCGSRLGVRELCWNKIMHGNNDGAKESRIIPEF